MDARITAYKGTKYIGVETLTGQEIFAFYVREDTVISVLSGGDINNIPSPAKDYRTLMRINGITLKAGDLFFIPYNEVASTITVASGSILVYY